MQKNYYTILGVDKKATAEEIKKKFRKLSMQYHPDRLSGKSEEEKKKAEDKFKDIAEAYSVLSDENKRKQYDLFGTVDNNGFQSSNFNPFDLFKNMGGFDDDFSMFSQFKKQKKVRKGTDIRFTAKISLKELYNNSKHTITYKRYKPCHECNGNGSKSGNVEQCPYCNGTGMMTKSYQRGFITQIEQVVCPHCNGTGEIISNPCHKCNGTGLEQVEEKYTFNVPIGCFNDTYTIVNGGGNYPERNNGIKGNLQIIFKIIPNDNFSIDDNNPYNLNTSVDIPILDCITGCNTTIKGVNGEDIKIKIPSYSKHDTFVVIKGKGLNQPNKQRGDLIVYIKQKMPKQLNIEEKNIIEKLKKSANFK